MSVRGMNPNAEIVSKSQALMVNVSAAKGLQGVLKSNLGACRCLSLRLNVDPRTN